MFYQFHICLYKPLTDLKVVLRILSYFFECTKICNIIHSLKIKKVNPCFLFHSSNQLQNGNFSLPSSSRNRFNLRKFQFACCIKVSAFSFVIQIGSSVFTFIYGRGKKPFYIPRPSSRSIKNSSCYKLYTNIGYYNYHLIFYGKPLDF